MRLKSWRRVVKGPMPARARRWRWRETVISDEFAEDRAEFAK